MPARIKPAVKKKAPTKKPAAEVVVRKPILKPGTKVQRKMLANEGIDIVKRKRGRPPGSKNQRAEELLEVIETEGLTPLEYMLVEMRNSKNDKSTRLSAARDAAPYLHPRLASIMHRGDPKAPLLPSEITPDEFETAARKLLNEI